MIYIFVFPLMKFNYNFYRSFFKKLTRRAIENLTKREKKKTWDWKLRSLVNVNIFKYPYVKILIDKNGPLADFVFLIIIINDSIYTESVHKYTYTRSIYNPKRSVWEGGKCLPDILSNTSRSSPKTGKSIFTSYRPPNRLQ